MFLQNELTIEASIHESAIRFTTERNELKYIRYSLIIWRASRV